MVVEKPTGEFGVNLDASGPLEFMLFEVGITTFPVSSFDESLAELHVRRTVSGVFSNLCVGGVNAAVYSAFPF